MTDQPSSLLSKSVPEPSLLEYLRMVLFFFAIWLTVIVLALLGLKAHAESIPPTPKPDTTIHFADYMRFGGIATYRALDWKTTTDGIRIGAKEVVLPNAIAAHSGRLALYEAGMTGAEVGLSMLLIKHNHRRMAQTIDYLSIGAGMLFVAHNVQAIHTQESYTSKLVKE